jgi:hypothetical protein
MINLNELRIGNWIDEQGLKIQVGWIQTGLFESSEPIPLTEEILLATGFKQGGVVGFYYLDIGNDTFLVSGGDSVWVEKAINFKEEEVSVGLGGAESVHQLQNLYYALCNKEIDVKFETSDSNGI